MKRILFVLSFAATGILCAQSEETYEEILSRYLGRIEVVDGTNLGVLNVGRSGMIVLPPRSN